MLRSVKLHVALAEERNNSDHRIGPVRTWFIVYNTTMFRPEYLYNLQMGVKQRSNNNKQFHPIFSQCAANHCFCVVNLVCHLKILTFRDFFVLF